MSTEVLEANLDLLLSIDNMLTAAERVRAAKSVLFDVSRRTKSHPVVEQAVANPAEDREVSRAV